MINFKNLRVGDIVGTTSGSPLACLIRLNTWGWKYFFTQSKASHIAVVVDRGGGLLYLCEMLASGIAFTSLDAYDCKAPKQHFTFVGRHPALDDDSMRARFNLCAIELHAQHIKYGFDDLADYITDRVGIHIKEKENRIICSELPRVIFETIGVPYPAQWKGKCSPMDWQMFLPPLSDHLKEVLP